jgi:G3E family GTPase
MGRDKIPVTILTGFLGAGKTTILNRILTEPHGHRIAVIENEFGEIGIDHALVLNSEEEIFEMNNGCICCTVRGDLIRILSKLALKRDKFDYVLIETTGLADPGPVAQTFFVDQEIQDSFSLDGIVTVVDARHFESHSRNIPECLKQIAFSDLIYINKVDLVSQDELAKTEKSVRHINSIARIYHSSQQHKDVSNLLDLGGFDLARAIQIDPQFLSPEYPFEWCGIFEFESSCYNFSFQPNEKDLSMKFCIFQLNQEEEFLEFEKLALMTYSQKPIQFKTSLMELDQKLVVEIPLSLRESTLKQVNILRKGRYAIVMQHLPEELNLKILNVSQEKISPVRQFLLKPEHHHAEDVTSVGIELLGDLHPDKFQNWISSVLQTQGQNIFRSKGILSLANLSDRFIFQGVHMLIDSGKGKPWGKDHRKSQIIFIGKNLDREFLTSGFQSCLVDPVCPIVVSV